MSIETIDREVFEPGAPRSVGYDKFPAGKDTAFVPPQSLEKVFEKQATRLETPRRVAAMPIPEADEFESLKPEEAKIDSPWIPGKKPFRRSIFLGTLKMATTFDPDLSKKLWRELYPAETYFDPEEHPVRAGWDMFRLMGGSALMVGLIPLSAIPTAVRAYKRNKRGY